MLEGWVAEVLSTHSNRVKRRGFNLRRVAIDKVRDKVRDKGGRERLGRRRRGSKGVFPWFRGAQPSTTVCHASGAGGGGQPARG